MIPVLTTSFAILSKFQSEAELERVPPAAEPRGGIPRDFAFRLGNDSEPRLSRREGSRVLRVSIAFRLENDLGPAERVRKDHDRRVSITFRLGNDSGPHGRQQQQFPQEPVSIAFRLGNDSGLYSILPCFASGFSRRVA